MGTEQSDGDFDLAIKMMFNYGIESNAHSLYNEMEKELLPSRVDVNESLQEIWENG